MEDTYTKGNDYGIEDVFTIFGLSDFEDYKLVEHYNDDDISEMMIGHRPISFNGETKEIVVVSIRGTDGTIEEWSSNFDVGANTDEYYEAIGVKPEEMGEYWWDEKSNHKGFDVAANRLYKRLIKYIDENTNKDLPTVVYIVGHSRGAAIANILGTRIEDDTSYEPFVYTFASPATTTDLDKIDDYDFIFNIVNEDDLVTYLPLSKWGFDRYGITYSASIVEEYENRLFDAQEGTWEHLFGEGYNYNNNLPQTVTAMEGVASCREDVYKYTGEKDTKVSYHFKSVDECKRKLGNRITRFCNLRFDTTLINETKIEQTPAAFMMILADLTATFEHDPDTGHHQAYNSKALIAGFKVADRYDSAKMQFCLSGLDTKAWAKPIHLGGMEHGHMLGTYYFLSNDYEDKLKSKTSKELAMRLYRILAQNMS